MSIRSLGSLGFGVVFGLTAALVFASPSFAQRKPAAAPKPAIKQPAAKPTPGAKAPANAKAKAPAKSAAPAKATDYKPLDLRYITVDFSLAVIVHPQDILALPLVRALPVEIAQATAFEQLGIDLTKLREIMVLLAVDKAGEPQPAVIARFSEAVDQAAVEAKVRQLFQRAGPEAPLAIVPEPNTVLVGRRELLEKMFLAKGDAASPLLARLRKLDSGGTAAAVAIVEPLRDELRAAVDNLMRENRFEAGLVPEPLVPPALADVAALPDMLDSVQLSLTLGTDKTDSTFLFECRDEASATRLEALLDHAIQYSTDSLEARLGMMRSAGSSQIEQAPLLYARRMLEEMISSIERKRTGNTFAIRGRNEIGAALGFAAIAAGLMLPAVQSARQAARRAQATNNLKQIGLAFQNYHDVFRRFPTSTYDKDGKPLLSWRVHILPFVEAQALYQQFHLDEPWDSDHNKKLITQMPTVYRNPDFVDAERTNYLAAIGPAAVFPEGKDEKGADQAVVFRKGNVNVAWARQVSFQNITDGTSNTIQVVEADPEAAVVWTQPDDLAVDPQQPQAGLGGLRKTGFNALFCDGSVHFIKAEIEPEILQRLFNPRDGMAIPPGSY